MTFAGVNYLAVVIAAVVAFGIGAGWYMSLGKIWVEAQGLTPEKMQSNKSKLPFIYTFVALLVMAWVLAGLMAHLGPGQVTLVNGVISGAFCWLGFVITALAVNLSFAMRDMRLLWIDGGHWLIVLAVMGAIIGAMGV